MLLPGTPAPKLGEHLLLGLFTDGAGVEQEHVRILGPRDELQTMGLPQHVRDTGGIVLVHLAAVGLDEELLGHDETGRRKGSDCPSTRRLCQKGTL